MWIIRQLRRHGHVAYLAGGCVRDELLGLPAKDYDVATDARPDQVQQYFPRSRSVGEAFGVVLVRRGGCQIEVATFRKEWGYRDGRRPDHIQFTDAQHDAFRRDFTINGLFAEPADQEPADPSAPARLVQPPPPTRHLQPPLRIIDYVGGLEDLQAGLIRAIGQPQERFAEDFLRLLRAVRFAARFNFQIEPATAQAIRHYAPKLALISRERIGQELRWMFQGPRPGLAAHLIQDFRLDEPTLQEPPCQAPPVTLSSLSSLLPFGSTLAAWLIDRHVQPARLSFPQEIRQRLDRLIDQDLESLVNRWRAALCLSNNETEDLENTLRLVAQLLQWPNLTKAQRKRLLAQPQSSAARLVLAGLGAHAQAADLAQQIAHDAASLTAEGLAPPPYLNGDDLIALGLEPGPQFRQILDQAYDLQLEGQLTDRPAALAWLRQHIQSLLPSRSSQRPPTC